MPFAADAAGLGKLSVISGLGEPLNAEIELLSTSPDELSSLSAAIAPEEAYTVQGLERPAVHNAIKIEIGKKPDGTPILKLSTRQPVSDPFLDMLIQVDWSTGRLLREYTVLLDPPGYTSPSQVSVVSQPASKPEASSYSYVPPAPATKPITSTPARKSAGKKSNKRALAETETVSASEETSPVTATSGQGEEYTTVKGDTLNAIATRTQVEGVNLDQMLVGLYRANKDAFIDGNMNRLKVGQIIRTPTADELQRIDVQQAKKEIRAQSADWNAYRHKLAGMVAETSASSETSSSQSSSGKLTTKAEDKALPEATGPKDVVKLSKNDTGTKAANAKAVQDKLNALQEEATARENSVKEANDRVAALEKQIADMQKLLTIKNQAMSDLQKNAAPPKTETAKAEPPKPVEPPKPAEAKPETVPAAPIAEEAKPVESPKPLDAPKPGPKPAEPVKKAEAPPPPPPPPAPVEEEGLLGSLIDDPLVLGGVGGAITLLGGTWVFLRRKRRKNLDGFEQAILTSGGLKANTVFGNTAGGSIDTGSSFLTDFSQSGSGMIDTNDVDPIAEAEVYMAYGRDSQAEEILKDAISKEPKRYELHLKLLEILAGRNDTSGFETIAGELYTTLGAGDSTWSKVAEIGRKMEPDNPLYQMSAPSSSTDDLISNQKLDVSDFESAEVMSESSLDFSLDADTSNVEDIGAVTEQQSGETTSLDFDLGSAFDSAPSSETEEISFDTPGDAALADVDAEIADLDFPLDTAEPEVTADTALEFDLASTQTIPGMDIEVETPADSDAEIELPDFGNTMPGLEMPELAVPAAENVTPAFESTMSGEALAMPELDTLGEATDAAPISESIDISFDLPEIATKASATEELSAPAASIDLELPDFEQTVVTEAVAVDDLPELDSGLDISFDLDVGEDTTSSDLELPDMAIPEPAVSAAPEIDLSGISLDLDAPAEAETSGAELVEDIAESSEVETKLDLVTAYIDMGDSEGARELLDEVLKEGGPNQRKRAQDLLSSLG